MIIERIVSAFRERDAFGRIRPAPAFEDATNAERREAFTETLLQRQLEAALDPDGLSTTGRAVLARIQMADPPTDSSAG